MFLSSEKQVTEVASTWNSYWRKTKGLGLDSYTRYFWREHLAYMMPVFKKLPEESTVIEIGVGTGSLLRMVHETTRLRVIGLDISRNAIRQAKLRFSPFKSNSSLVLGDVFHLPFRDGSFDVVICLGLIEHFEDSFTPMSNVLKLVKKGGYAFISVPQRASLYAPYKRWQIRRKTWPFGFEKEFTMNELREMCKRAGLSSFKVVGVDFYPFPLMIIPVEWLFRPLVVRIVRHMENRIRNSLRLAHMLMIVSKKT